MNRRNLTLCYLAQSLLKPLWYCDLIREVGVPFLLSCSTPSKTASGVYDVHSRSAPASEMNSQSIESCDVSLGAKMDANESTTSGMIENRINIGSTSIT